ncbi:MAG: hypothetical protein IJ796_01235 [Lachnospiraceae bacterium]|nr:hypothetical protein [Lachnospiraceae bacterium]
MESRSNVSHDHIDASFYKEDGYYYYVIKENGVTDEIWRTKDLSKTNDPSVWEEVCYDAVTGYEGPCLTKYQGQYFLYMDRLSSYEPTLLDDSQGSAFGSEGTWVAKASIGTTGALDGYTGWLETNIHEIKTWTDKDRSSTKANRHGTVITVSGEAAAKVRALAKAKGYPDSMLANTYSASSWDNTGWYYKESYRGDIGELKNSIVKYYYENDKRIGTSKDNSIGAERNLKIGDMAENPYYFKADSSDPELDGKMYCTNAATGYYGGEVEAKLPVDFAYYNEVGAEKYGNANTSWRWMRYDWQGIIRRCGNEDNNRLYQDGKTGKWYRYDPETGYMVKGAFGYQVPLENGDKEWRFMWFDLNSGEQLLGQGDYVEDYLNVYNSGNTSIRLGDVFTKLTVNRRDYYFDKYGTAWYEKYVYGGAPGVFGGPIASVVTTPGVLPVVEYHSPKLDAFDETGHPTEGNAWYKPDGENGKWYWYENGVRQGISADEKGVYGTDEETGRAINRGREICDNNILDANGNGTWFWLDSDANGARAVGKEVWVPYIFQDEGTWTLEQMKEVASESDPCMVNYVYECMALGSGKWVRYDENGHMLKGWVTIEGALADKYPDQVGNTYYYDTKTGLLAKGWINMDGAVYYFDSVTGVMKHDETLEINGVSYTFSSDGKCTNPPAV